MSQWRLLITRPADDSAALAQTLSARGHYACSMPLLAIESLDETPEQAATVIELHRYCAVIVVSKPAARLALERVDRYWPQPLADQPWFSVGAATAAVLQDYGLRVYYPCQGDDSEALLAMPELHQAIASDAVPRVLIIRGEDGREWLAERLRAAGAAVDYLPLYRRVLPSYPSGELRRRVEAERLNALVVSSGQGLAHLLQVAGQDWPHLARMPLFVPSPRVAELARAAGAQQVVDCRGASSAALLAALEQHSSATL